jgi:sugar lactone lactonase YvrE
MLSWVGLLAAGQAFAAEPAYLEIGPLGGPSSRPHHVATEHSTGNVFVVNRNPVEVQVYGPDGADGADPIASFGAADLTAGVSGIAVDQSNGDLYVYDPASGLLRYTSDGGAPPTYTKDAGYIAPGIGSGLTQVGSGGGALAVDPSNHDLLVADTLNARVSRFAQDGSFKSSFNGSDTTGGSFSGPIDLAVAPDGDIYVVDAIGDLIFGGTSRAEHFDATGTTKGQLPVLGPNSIAIDGSTQRVVVAAMPLSGYPRLYLFDQGVLVSDRQLPDEFRNCHIYGLVLDNAHRLYASRDFFGTEGDVRAFEAVVYRDVTLAAPSAVTTTGAHLSGTVSPSDAIAHFEYSTDGATWTSTPDQDASTTAGVVQDDLSGLEPNETYRVRLVAINRISSTSDERTFTTVMAPPAVMTGNPTSMTTSGARLNGTVNPEGAASTYHFEYGTDTGYGQRVPATDAEAGDRRAPRVFSRAITGLTAGTTYHFRIVATNAAGTTNGDDRTLTTRASEPPARGFEMVSPVDKSGSAVRPRASHHASLSGDSVVYTTKTPIGRASPSGTFQSRYFAKRGPTGWSFKALDPPQISTDDRSVNVHYTRLISSDNSKALVVSNKALGPGGVEGQGNLYIRDTATDAYTLVATSGATDVVGFSFYDYLEGLASDSLLVAGATDDFSAILFNSNVPLLPGARDGLYLWKNGTLRAITELPDGSPATTLQPGNVAANPDPENLSRDGRRVFFTAPFAADGLFMQQDGATPVGISVSHRTGDTHEPRYIDSYYGSSDDGSVVYFISNGGYGGLVDGPIGASDLYRYDVNSDEMTIIADDAGPVVQVAGDGHYVYYTGVDGAFHVWHDGQRHQVTPPLSYGLGGEYLVSPNGKYFTFQHSNELTGYDNTKPGCLDHGNAGTPTGHCQEVFLYSADEDSLRCVSCNPDGSRPNGPADQGENGGITLSYRERIVLDNGRVFFNSPDQLVAADSGGGNDVYMYDHGELTLISGGKPGYESIFADSDATGDNVFFTTNQRLVGQDTDDLIDEYDSRVGGGLASQNPPAAPAGCSGEGCLGAPASAPSREPAGTVTFRGDGNVVGPGSVRLPGSVRVSLPRKTVRGISGTIRVRTPGRGRIGLSGPYVRSVTRGVSKAGTVTLRFSLTGKGRAALKRKHQMRVTLKISFVPTGGQRTTASVGITFRTSKGGSR